jgi:hypothetical protein
LDTLRSVRAAVSPTDARPAVRDAVPPEAAVLEDSRVTPFAPAAGRAGRPAAGSFLALAFALAFDLALFDFDLADLALGLSAFSALAAFFAALPLPVLPLAALVGAANFCATAGRAAAPGAWPALAVVPFSALRPAPPRGAAAVVPAAFVPVRGAALAAVLVVAGLRAVARVVVLVVAGLRAVARVVVLVVAGLAVAARVVVLVVAGLRVVARVAVLAAAGLAVADLDGVDLAGAGAGARALAVSLSDVTAVSSALVAVEIAPSALVSVFADAAAWVAAAFSSAEVTLVAPEAAVRGAAVVVRPVVVRFAELRAAFAVPLAPDDLAAAVFAAAGLAAPELFAAPALPVREPEPARAELVIRTGAALAAAFFVGGTDLPPIWIS